MMKKNNKGFTLAELLIVVAITVVLMGVAFIAVQNYQRSSTRLEYDGIAKEIFIAAQNHLTTAQSQGYLQLSSNNIGTKNDEQINKELGRKGTSSFDTYGDERYFVYKEDSYSADPQKSESVLDLMLPFGAIDETVRAGGTYIIRYQPSSARVLDVFYSLPGRSSMLTVSGTTLTSGDYETLMVDTYRRDNNEGRRARQEFSRGVIGWYGGEEGLPKGTHLDDPEIIVHNEEVLWVEVIDNNLGAGSLQLIITGKTSGAQTSFDPRSLEGRVISNGTVILDDITRSGYHFADLSASNKDKDGNQLNFIPGEDIIIEAVAYNNAALTNVAYSGKKTTNSLFADLQEKEESGTLKHTASIENFRHLENLDATISYLDNHDTEDKLNVVSSVQIKDLTWTNDAPERPSEKPDVFIEAVWNITGTKPSSIYDRNNTAATTESRYYPVSPGYLTEYDGQNHSVLNLRVNHSGDAGMFGTLVGSSIKNVFVRNEVKTGTDASFEIKGTGNVGGLVGSMTGGSVTNCAAAVYVNGATAGGLIGKMSGGTVLNSYSGGHTQNGQYLTTESGAARVNVIATGDSGNAGGLIGDAGSTTISNSYSTCSVTGANAGGFVGSASGEISNCYCTGLVSGTTEGAFAASLGGTATSCLYYEIINERPDTEKGFIYLNALGEEKTESGISGIDSDVTTYNNFVGGESTWYPANPYDSQLRDFYNGKYPLRTVSQIAADNKVKNEAETGIGATHYGDWPSPEIFVINTATSSS